MTLCSRHYSHMIAMLTLSKLFAKHGGPRTNTSITSSGEISISLRDLYMLGGLPSLGEIYDERIPNALDLDKGSYKCCAYLFEAFFHLTQQEDRTTFVEASRWIDFWCRKTRRYAAPPPRNENKKSRPKATHNPSGILEPAPRRSHVSEAPFVELNIPPNLEQEVYCRQFGFYQASAPGLLLTDDRDVTLAKGFQLHRQTYKAWLVDVHANLLENRVTVREGITQEQRDQLDTLRKGKAPVHDAPHDQVSKHATQKRREEQVRHRSSDDDVDSDHNFKRNRRPSTEGSVRLLVNNDARSSNQHYSIGEVEHSDSSESLNQVVTSHQSLSSSNPPHQEAQPEPSHVSILPVFLPSKEVLELVTKAQEQRNTSQEVVNSAEETVKRIQETPILTDEDEDKLSFAKKDLEADKEYLMNFRIV
nr:ABC transporter G family member 11 [Ipomoea batatas]